MTTETLTRSEYETKATRLNIPLVTDDELEAAFEATYGNYDVFSKPTFDLARARAQKIEAAEYKAAAATTQRSTCRRCGGPLSITGAGTSTYCGEC